MFQREDNNSNLLKITNSADENTILWIFFLNIFIYIVTFYSNTRGWHRLKMHLVVFF